jgi:hypothetical protein
MEPASILKKGSIVAKEKKNLSENTRMVHDE